jgi:hypothetical protein
MNTSVDYGAAFSLLAYACRNAAAGRRCEISETAFEVVLSSYYSFGEARRLFCESALPLAEKLDQCMITELRDILQVTAAVCRGAPRQPDQVNLALRRHATVFELIVMSQAHNKKLKAPAYREKRRKRQRKHYQPKKKLRVTYRKQNAQ